ncbi:MAG TPA: glycosyltransferase, partial [Clostridia bacterium]
MKVLVITNLYPNAAEPNRGIFIKQQVDRLAARCDVKVIAPLPFYKSIPETLRAKTIPFSVAVEFIGDIEVYHPRYYYTPKILRSLYGIYYFLSIYFLCRKMEEIYKPDIYLNYWIYPDGFATVATAKLLGKKVVTSSRGCDVNHYTRKFMLKSLITWTLRNADLNLTVSEKMRSMLISMGIPSEKVIAVPNGIDKKLFYPIEKKAAREILSLPLHKRTILYIGRLDEEKNVQLLINA